MKARALLLLCGLSLAGTAAADPLGAPRHSPDGWIFGSPAEGYSPPRTAAPRSGKDAAVIPQPLRHAAIVPLPRPRPYVLQTTTGAIELEALKPPPAPPTAPVPQPTPLGAPAPQDVTTPELAPPAAVATAPARDNGGAAVPPVSVSNAGGGRIRIEAHEASLGQVLAALQDSHLIRLSAADAPPRTITGTYTGTLPQVLSRILDGQNYFLRVTESGTEFHAINAASDANASGETNAVLQSAVSSSIAEVATAPPPTPPPTFALSPANPAGQTQARVTPGPAAKARARRQR